MANDWYTHPYSGGPMVKVDGFPRPLYPPDANQQGKKPSVDGPDVEAYKRIVSRAGRWDWQPFDDSFSNAFSHGKSGNVGDTGIAGVQRQQHIDATGWIGQATFNTLRSIRVPDGKPHAGEMCMDATAANLINEAYAKFGGHEPASGGKVAAAALKKAQGQVGVKESPSGSNNNKYGKWYGDNGVPWCAIFCTWCFELSAQDLGKDSPTFVKGSRYAYVPYMVSDAHQGKYGLSVTLDPTPGCLVAYDWSFDGTYDHVGIFEKWVNGTQWQAIEGNTSTSNNSNGGEVMRRTRTQGAQAVTFMAVREP